MAGTPLAILDHEVTVKPFAKPYTTKYRCLWIYFVLELPYPAGLPVSRLLSDERRNHCFRFLYRQPTPDPNWEIRKPTGEVIRLEFQSLTRLLQKHLTHMSVGCEKFLQMASPWWRVCMSMTAVFGLDLNLRMPTPPTGINSQTPPPSLVVLGRYFLKHFLAISFALPSHPHPRARERGKKI